MANPTEPVDALPAVAHRLCLRIIGPNYSAVDLGLVLDALRGAYRAGIEAGVAWAKLYPRKKGKSDGK